MNTLITEFRRLRLHHFFLSALSKIGFMELFIAVLRLHAQLLERLKHCIALELPLRLLEVESTFVCL